MTLFLLFACNSLVPTTQAGTVAAPPPPEGKAVAYFAGGCFWCMEKPFDVIPGVETTLSGYTGGTVNSPTYDAVANKRTDHKEAIRVLYDPNKVSYERLLEVFWHNIDPTQDNGQFCDKGPQYKSAIFPLNDAQKKSAQSSLASTNKTLGGKVVTTIENPGPFWVAETYHQDFYKKEPDHYLRYRTGCGRDQRLKELWGDQAGH